MREPYLNTIGMSTVLEICGKEGRYPKECLPLGEIVRKSFYYVIPAIDYTKRGVPGTTNL